MANTTFSTIGTNTTGVDSTNGDAQIKVFFAVGLYWAFWTDGNVPAVYLKTSVDGVTWSARTTISTLAVPVVYPNGVGAAASFFVSGTIVYYVIQGAPNFYWRYGTLNANGTISWTIAETGVALTNALCFSPFIFVDGSGNVWIAAFEQDAGVNNLYLDVYEYTGSWSNVLNKTLLTGLNSTLVNTSTCRIMSLANGKMVLIWTPGLAITESIGVVDKIYISYYNGSSWSTTISSSNLYFADGWSAVTIGNTLHFVGVASSTAITTVKNLSAINQNVLSVNSTDNFIVGDRIGIYNNINTNEQQNIGSIQTNVSLTTVLSLDTNEQSGWGVYNLNYGQIRYWNSVYPFTTISTETILDSYQGGLWATLQTDQASTLTTIFARSTSNEALVFSLATANSPIPASIIAAQSTDKGATWRHVTLPVTESFLFYAEGSAPYLMNGDVAYAIYTVGQGGTSPSAPFTTKFLSVNFKKFAVVQALSQPNAPITVTQGQANARLPQG